MTPRTNYQIKSDTFLEQKWNIPTIQLDGCLCGNLPDVMLYIDQYLNWMRQEN